MGISSPSFLTKINKTHKNSPTHIGITCVEAVFMSGL